MNKVLEVRPQPQHLQGLAAAFLTAPHGLALLSRDCRYIAVNAQFASMHGLDEQSFTGQSISEMQGQPWSQLLLHLHRCIVENDVVECEVTVTCRRSGKPLTYLYTSTPVHDTDGAILALSLGLLDITERKRVETALSESREHYRYAMELNPHIPWTATPDGMKLEVSPRWTTFTQLPAGIILVEDWAKTVYPEDLAQIRTAWSESIRTGEPYDAEYRVLCGDQRLCWVRARASARRGPDGEVVRWYGVLENINAPKRIEVALREKTRRLQISTQQLAAQVSKDHLTGLANRRSFDDVLDREMLLATEWQLPLSLVMIDVDYFKSYNDHFGHVAGDQCLRKIGGALTSILRRPSDLVARYGGEEFAIILPNTGLQGARKIAQEALAAVRELSLAHCAPHKEVVTISAGAAAFEGSKDALAVRLVATLLQRADSALYAAKRGGRDQVALHA